MKRLAVCAVMFAAMVITGTVLYVHTGNVTADISTRLAALEKEPAPETARSIAEDWEKFCDGNIFLTNNECAFEISRELAHINAEIAAGEEDVAEECRTAAALVALYDKSRRLDPDNIF